MSGEMAEKAAATAAKPVKLLAGDGGGICNKAVVELAVAERQREVRSPLEVSVLHTEPEARRRILVSKSKGCVVHSPENQVHLAMADHDVANFSKLSIIRGKIGKCKRSVMKTSGDDDKARITPTAELGLPLLYFNTDPFVEHSIIEELRRSPILANKDSKFPLGEKKWPPFSSWLATTKEAIFARKNLPARATLVASFAAAGVITTAANPAICFGFYALFIAAIAFVIIPLRKI